MAKRDPASTDVPLETLAVITDRLRLLITRRAEMWWDIGQLLDEVATRGLAPVAGHRDFAAYAKRVLALDPKEARALRRVAHHFSRDIAIRFGLQKLDSLLQFADASRETTWFLEPTRISIPVKIDGEVVSVPFSECTLDQLKLALKLNLRAGAASTDPAVPLDVEPDRARLEGMLAKEIGNKSARVKIHRGPDNPWDITFAIVGVSPANMAAVGRVLSRQARVYERMAIAQLSKTAPTTKKKSPGRG